jgi:alkylation response protein AidB-like acyl-CoA dehydrogenase
MDLALTGEQRALVDSVRSLLGRRADSAAVRAAMASEHGYDEALWTTLCEQIGAAALAIPEEYGGAGGSVVETALVLEELGRTLAPTPLLSSLIASETLLASGDRDACAELLPRIAAGAVTTEPAATLDPTFRMMLVDVDGLRATPRAHDAALIGLAALAMGCMQRGLDMTVAYTQQRVQFGRPIGSFQALKHRMADMLVLVEMSRSAAWAAARGLIAPEVAASYCGEAVMKVAGETIQLHGGIAITWEHDAHLVLKRAHALTTLMGHPHHLRAPLL